MLVESILFSFFTLELVGEQLEAFQDNQTYVDDLKELVGIPYTLIEALRVWIGEDWLFWALPTQPVLKINYCERLYRAQEIVSQKYLKIPVIDYDPSGKMKAVAVREANQDKIYFAVTSCLIIATCYYLASAY